MDSKLLLTRTVYNQRYGCWTECNHWSIDENGNNCLNGDIIHESGERESLRAIRLFAERENVDASDCYLLAQLGQRYAKQSANADSGVWHSLASTNDKNEFARLWNKQAETTANAMTRLVKAMGFAGLDFGVGYYPTIETTAGKSLHFPYGE